VNSCSLQLDSQPKFVGFVQMLDFMVAWSVCLSVILLHPAEAVVWNKMPFGRDTFVGSSNIVSVPGRGRFLRTHIENLHWKLLPTDMGATAMLLSTA